jgi:hypothetical protein
MVDRLGRLGHQNLKKEYFTGPSVFMPWRVTGIIKIFCLWRVFLFPKIMFFGNFVVIF